MLRPVEQEGVSLRDGDRKKPREGDRDAFLEGGRQSNVIDIREAMRARRRRIKEELR